MNSCIIEAMIITPVVIQVLYLILMQDGELVVNNATVELTERNQSLKIAHIKWDNVGKYSCVVKNRLHNESVYGHITIAGEKDRERTVCCIDGSGHREYFFFLFCLVQTENGATLWYRNKVAYVY